MSDKKEITVRDLIEADVILTKLSAEKIKEGKWGAAQAWSARTIKKAVQSHLSTYEDTVRELRISTGLAELISPLDKFVTEYGTKNQYGNLIIDEESEHFVEYEELKLKLFSDTKVIEAGNKFSAGVNEMLFRKVDVNTVKLNLVDLDKIEYLSGDDLDKIEYFLDV